MRAFGVREFLLPPPTKILTEFLAQPGFLLMQSLDTLQTTLAGFVLAVVLGVGSAIGIVYSRFLDRTLYSLMVALNAVPKVALAPLFVIWLGTGSAPKIAIAMLIAIFPILIDTVLGLKSIDPEMLNMARANQASRSKVLWKIRFPNALPSIFAGMKVGVSFALVGTIVGEFVAGETGLGHVILVAQGSFDTPTVFVALALLCALGVILFKALEWAEERMLPWHASQRGRPGQDHAPAPGTERLTQLVQAKR
ncbi:binding-protein dependent transport system inner membrane protein [Cupriavidus basilensis OR16]|uniref:Binding-protein dependent transport system inner membrane protein n=1 Tax=Cupriavidus basilensis OR16 TaxID=1127483 RepID=H1S984_9BURK|nr:binding-protein dependent transport system inner membrane protein [Cupriavidus basilensis OR16]